MYSFSVQLSLKVSPTINFAQLFVWGMWCEGKRKPTYFTRISKHTHTHPQFHILHTNSLCSFGFLFSALSCLHFVYIIWFCIRIMNIKLPRRYYLLWNLQAACRILFPFFLFFYFCIAYYIDIWIQFLVFFLFVLFSLLSFVFGVLAISLWLLQYIFYYFVVSLSLWIYMVLLATFFLFFLVLHFLSYSTQSISACGFLACSRQYATHIINISEQILAKKSGLCYFFLCFHSGPPIWPYRKK